MADDDIRVRIAGDLADINKSLADLRRQTRGSGDDAKKANRDFNSFGNGLDKLKRQVAGVVGAYLGFRAVTSAVRAVVRASVEQERVLAQVEARIKSTGGAAGVTTAELAEMAAQFQRSTTFSDQDILNAQSQLLTFTKITRENFETTTEAVLNLSTAMQQDLRTSVISIGKALNDPILGLTSLTRSGIQFTAAQREAIRSLVETGQVAAAQRVILDELETQFGGAARAARDTFGGALESLKNAAGDLLEADGGLPGITAAINELTETLQDPNTREAMQTLIGGLFTAGGVAANAASEFARLGQQIGLIAARIAGGVTEVDLLEQELRDVERALDGNTFTTPLRFLSTSREELEQLRADLKSMLALARTDGFQPVTRPGTTDAASDSGGDVVDTRIDLRALESSLKAAGVVLQDELKRLREGLDRELQAGLISYGDYFKQRAAIESQQIEQTLAQRRNSLALLDEEISLLEARGESTEKLEAQRAQLIAGITVLERQRADVAINSTRDQAAAEASLAAELRGVATRLKELQGDTVGARADELAAEFSALIQRLAIEGDVAGIALVQSLVNVEMAKVRLDQLQTDYQTALADMARAEQSIQAQVISGSISEGEGRRQIIALYQRTAQSVRELIPLMRALAEATGDPAAIQRIKDVEASLEDLATRANEAAAQMRAGIQDSAEDAFASFIAGTRSAKDAFRDFAEDVIRQMARIAAQQIVGSLFSGFFPTAHSGGIAGQGATRKRISPLAFLGAPRMHLGGIAGLSSGEVPTILMRGEEVLTENDPRHRNNGGAASVEVNIDARNSDDPARLMSLIPVIQAQIERSLELKMRRGYL
jgi:hypothetical protein